MKLIISVGFFPLKFVKLVGGGSNGHFYPRPMNFPLKFSNFSEKKRVQLPLPRQSMPKAQYNFNKDQGFKLELEAESVINLLLTITEFLFVSEFYFTVSRVRKNEETTEY